VLARVGWCVVDNYGLYVTMTAVTALLQPRKVPSMDKLLTLIGSMMFGLRFIMSLFYLGLVLVMTAILWKFCGEIFTLISPVKIADMSKIDMIIKVLELVDMTMVAQLVWVVALAGFSLFVTAAHFDNDAIKKPDWLDHVNTYNLKLKLAFAIISISGVHALKNYLQGDTSIDIIIVATVHFIFVISAVGIALAEWLARKSH